MKWPFKTGGNVARKHQQQIDQLNAVEAELESEDTADTGSDPNEVDTTTSSAPGLAADGGAVPSTPAPGNSQLNTPGAPGTGTETTQAPNQPSGALSTEQGGGSQPAGQPSGASVVDTNVTTGDESTAQAEHDARLQAEAAILNAGASSGTADANNTSQPSNGTQPQPDATDSVLSQARTDVQAIRDRVSSQAGSNARTPAVLNALDSALTLMGEALSA